jgi:hypothetical protein
MIKNATILRTNATTVSRKKRKTYNIVEKQLSHFFARCCYNATDLGFIAGFD